MLEPRQVRSLHDILGWFPPLDQALLEHFLNDDAVAPYGDLGKRSLQLMGERL